MSIKFSKLNNDSNLHAIEEERCSASFPCTSEDINGHGTTLSTEKNYVKLQDGRLTKSRPKTVVFEHHEKDKPGRSSSATAKPLLKSMTCSVLRAPPKCPSPKDLHGLHASNKHLSDQTNGRWSVYDHRICGLNTRLLDAIEHHKNDQVDSLLKDGASPNATCRAGNISACHAAAFANGDALRSLLQHNVDKNRKDKYGYAPLHLAACAGRNGTIAMLLDFPTDLQTKVELSMTPDIEKEVKTLRPRISSLVDISCEFQAESVLPTTWKDSIEHKCTRYIALFPKLSPGWTPLHIASFGAHHNATRLLLAAGANPNSKDAMGQTPLDVAGAKINNVDVKNYVETLKTLIEYGGELNKSVSTPPNSYSALHTAVELCSVEAIKSLLAADAPVTHHNGKGNTPLHECVAKCYKEPLEYLAKHCLSDKSRSSIDVTNNAGYTVLHVAVLTSWIPGVCVALDNGADVTVEAYDGYTAIHLAALQGHEVILSELLNAAGNKVSDHDSGCEVDTPLLCAIRSGNLECVKKILDAGGSLHVTTYADPAYNDKANHKYDPKRSYKKLPEHNMILHAAAQIGFRDILEFLLNHESSLKELLAYRCPDLINTTPVEYAAFNNKTHTFEFLLQKTVERAETKQQTLDPSEMVMICARAPFNSEHIFRKIIDMIPDAVPLTIEKGHFPLHEAIMHGKKDLVYDLLYNGADLSQSDKNGKTALSLFYEYFPNPTKLIKNIFDDYICTSSRCYDANCHTYVDYRVLIPTANSNNDQAQLRVVKALLKTGNMMDHKTVLAHPLVESFLYLKWKSISIFFYMIILIYMLFALSVSAYVLSIYYYIDKVRLVPMPWNPHMWQYCIYVTLTILIVQELSDVHLSTNFWIKTILSIEFWIKLASFSFAVAIPQILHPDMPVMRLQNNQTQEMLQNNLTQIIQQNNIIHTLLQNNITLEILQNNLTQAILQYNLPQEILHNNFTQAISSENNLTKTKIQNNETQTSLQKNLTLIIQHNNYIEEAWRRHISTLTLVLSWINIMLLLCKTPMTGYYIYLFWKVSTNLLKILLTFSFLIIVFSACFMIQFHVKQPFDGPIASLTKTLVMMTAEFEYADTFTKDNIEKSVPIQALRVVFVIFLVFAAMVLMNLMVGVAVNDLQELFVEGNLQRLEKQVEFLSSWEVSAHGTQSLYQILGLYRWFLGKKVLQKVEVALDKTCPYEEHIREAILKIAYQQFDDMEKKREAKRNETALDEIRTAIRSCSFCAICGSDKKPDTLMTDSLKRSVLTLD